MYWRPAAIMEWSPNRNIGIMDYDIGGETGSEWASSGTYQPDGSIGQPTTTPYFEATPLSGNDHPTDIDSEYKLLNWAAKRFNPTGALITHPELVKSIKICFY